MFVRAHPRETQEMVFDVHDRAFALFRGTCTHGIYDNIRTAMDAILAWRDRTYDGRFLQMWSHHLVHPVACTLASGWETSRCHSPAGSSDASRRQYRDRHRELAIQEPRLSLLIKPLQRVSAHQSGVPISTPMQNPISLPIDNLRPQREERRQNTAYRNNVTGILQGHPAFHNVRKG